MTSIVERLRNPSTGSFGSNWGLRDEAADEIERLTAVVEFANRVVEAKNAEIEKLTEQLEVARELREYDRGTINIQRAEIIRLKEEKAE